MKTLLIAILSFFLLSGGKHEPCGKYNGKNIYKGKDGGCYYLKGKEHRKVYIEKKHCKC